MSKGPAPIKAEEWSFEHREPLSRPVVPSRAEPAAEGPDDKVAVLVAHGMGTQVPFETLDLVVDGVVRTNGDGWDVDRKVGLRNVRLGEEDLRRVELTMRGPAGEKREVHVYEAYWAPLTEGKVKLSDTLGFLVSGGVNGAVNGMSVFRRRLFGKLEAFGRLDATTAILLLALAVIGSLAAMHFLAGAILAAQASETDHVAWPDAKLAGELTLALVAFLASVLVLGLLVLVAGRSRGRVIERLRRKGETPLPPAQRRLAAYGQAGMGAFAWALGAAVGFALAAVGVLLLHGLHDDPAGITRAQRALTYLLVISFAAFLYAASAAWSAWTNRKDEEKDAPGRGLQYATAAALALLCVAAALGVLLPDRAPWLVEAAGRPYLFAGAAFLLVGGLHVFAERTRNRTVQKALEAIERKRGKGVSLTPAEGESPPWKRRAAPSRADAPAEEPKAPEKAREVIPFFLGVAVLYSTFVMLFGESLPRPAWGPSWSDPWLWLFLYSAAPLILFTWLLALLRGALPIGLVLASLAGGVAAALLAPYAGGAHPAVVAIVWAGIAGASWFVRKFLVQFLGDVAAYVSPHTLDRFEQLRADIKERVKRVADAVYGARTADGTRFEYDRILVVGHSLGSVVAYDTLNGLLRDDDLARAKPAAGRKARGSSAASYDRLVAERTPLFLTFGSPLDRTAFVFATQHEKRNPLRTREALAALSQPLLDDPEARRSIRWVNVHSPVDVISSELVFYDPPRGKDAPWRHPQVRNVPDDLAATPLAAHVEYWTGREVWKHLRGAIHEKMLSRLSPPRPRRPRRRDRLRVPVRSVR